MDFANGEILFQCLRLIGSGAGLGRLLIATGSLSGEPALYVAHSKDVFASTSSIVVRPSRTFFRPS
jgi:hypothetical protein